MTQFIRKFYNTYEPISDVNEETTAMVKEASELLEEATGKKPTLTQWCPKGQEISYLANRFCETLHAWLGKKKMAQVVKLNKRERSKGICHSHDFCDANQAMLDAAAELGIEIGDAGENAKQTKIWVGAWNLAKDREFKVVRA